MLISEPQTLTPEHDVSQFDSGKPSLDAWLKIRAQRNQDLGFTAVVVVHDQQRVVGFYGLSPTAISPHDLPRRIRTGQPPSPIPCFLLGQLAVDREYRNLGIGGGLVGHAFARVVQSADLIGGRALIVQAIDESAASYWSGWRFTPAPNDPFQLVRSLDDIRAAVAVADKAKGPRPPTT